MKGDLNDNEWEKLFELDGLKYTERGKGYEAQRRERAEAIENYDGRPSV